MALGETLTGRRVEHQRGVIECRGCPAEGAVKEELSESGEKQIGTPDDFGDFHRGIIRNHRQLVGGYVVASPHDKVAKVDARHGALRSQGAIFVG